MGGPDRGEDIGPLGMEWVQDLLDMEKMAEDKDEGSGYDVYDALGM